MTENKNVGIIILAAGRSSRFGKPKQLLQFRGKSLIRRAVENALQSDCDPVIAVLGSEFELIKKEIENSECEIVFNENWQTGMSSSIKKGLEKILETSPGISGVIISLCDQPFIQSENYDEIIAKFYETKNPIIASIYNETIGVPAFFSTEFFPALSNLEGDTGAKEIIINHSETVEEISLSEAAIDIDTRDDFEKIKK